MIIDDRKKRVKISYRVPYVASVPYIEKLRQDDEALEERLLKDYDRNTIGIRVYHETRFLKEAKELIIIKFIPPEVELIYRLSCDACPCPDKFKNWDPHDRYLIEDEYPLGSEQST